MHSNCSLRQPQKHPNQPPTQAPARRGSHGRHVKHKRNDPMRSPQDPERDEKMQHPPLPLPTLIRYENITSDECKTKNRPKQHRIQGEPQAPKIGRPKSLLWSNP